MSTIDRYRPAWSRDPDRAATVVLLAAMALAIPVLIWVGRGVTYTIDELTWFMDSPRPGLDAVFQPHVGHLVLTARVAYKILFGVLGTGYLPFRVLTIATLLIMAWLAFSYMRTRVGSLAALPAAIVLLFFGSDPTHLLQGNGFTVLLSIACGLGALIALDRRDSRGDAVACGLLCLGVVTYTVALTYVFAAAVLVMLGANRWPRLWVVVVPALLYLAWWLWARHLPGSSEQQIMLSDVRLLPKWGFQSLAAALASLTGLRFWGTGGGAALAPGYALAIAALAGLAWRFRQAPITAALWSVIGLLLSLWTLQAIAPNAERLPWSPRYLYPVAVAVLLVGAEAVRGKVWSRTALIVLYAVAACGLASNLGLLRHSAADLRGSYAHEFRGELTGIELAGERASPDYVPRTPAATETRIDAVFDSFASKGDPPTATYLGSVRRYGRLGYSLQELRDLDPGTLAIVRTALSDALRQR